MLYSMYCYMKALHAIVAWLFGCSIKQFYIHWSGIYGFVNHTNNPGEVGSIIISLAGSFSSTLFCYFIYVIALYFFIKDDSVKYKHPIVSPFLLFSILLAKKFDSSNFYSSLVCIVLGYYLHFNRIIYAILPGCRSIMPSMYHYLSGDGTNVWDIITNSYKIKFFLFRVGVALNYIALVWLIGVALQTAKKFHMKATLH